MLGKLLKYDLKWVYKLIIVFYILALTFSLIGRGFGEIENSLICEIVSKIAFGTAISMMVSGLINCLMRSWVRFTRNMYKDEAYLTHTLPIEKKTIFASKVITGTIAVFTSMLVIIACLFICYYSKSNMEVLKSLLENKEFLEKRNAEGIEKYRKGDAVVTVTDENLPELMQTTQLPVVVKPVIKPYASRSGVTLA